MNKTNISRWSAVVLLGSAPALFAAGIEAMVVNLSDRDWQLKTVDTMSHIKDHDLDMTLLVRNLKTGARQEWAVGANETYTLHRAEAITFRAKSLKPMTKHSQYNRIQLVDHQGHIAATLATVLFVPSIDPNSHGLQQPISFNFKVDQALPNILVQAYADGPVVITGNEAGSPSASSAMPASEQ